MAQYDTSSNKYFSHTNNWLLGAPLMIISLFCFAYVMASASQPKYQGAISKQINQATLAQSQALPPLKFDPSHQLRTLDNSTSENYSKDELKMGQPSNRLSDDSSAIDDGSRTLDKQTRPYGHTADYKNAPDNN